MKIPGPDDLTELRGQSRVFYAVWIYRGLREYILEMKGPRAFKFAEDFINQPDDISEDLKMISLALDTRSGQRFGAACVQVFYALDHSEYQNIALGEVLLRLCVKIRAPELGETLKQKLTSLTPTGATKKLYELCLKATQEVQCGH